jgi:hypothetical protein
MAVVVGAHARRQQAVTVDSRYNGPRYNRIFQKSGVLFQVLHPKMLFSGELSYNGSNFVVSAIRCQWESMR